MDKGSRLGGALVLALATTFGASTSGCSKDADIAEFIKENDAFTSDMKKAKTVDEAKKAFDDHKSALQSKYDGIKDARGFQVKEESKKKLQDSVMEGAKACVTKALTIQGAKNVCDDYTKLLGVK